MHSMQALAISCPDWMAEMLAPDGRTPHITVSTAPGVKAKVSSDVVKAALKGHRRVSYLKVPEEPRRAARALVYSTLCMTATAFAGTFLTLIRHCAASLPALNSNHHSSARPVSLDFDLASPSRKHV